MNSKVICVVNNQEIFEKVVKNNENLKNCEYFVFDNTTENVAITKRYNSFIENEIESIQINPSTTNVMLNLFQHRKVERQCDPETSSGRRDDSFWCIFIHQDFGIMQDIDSLLKKLDRNNIYGAVGVKIFKGIFFGKKDKARHLGFKTSFKLTLGRILQGKNDFNFKKHWCPALFQPTVDAIDCCCIIIHSSLIKKYNLRFDENLNFHLYAEELCYRAKKDYKIKTKVVQMKCFHLGQGTLDEDFEKSAQYLKEKFHLNSIPSTCYT